MKLKKLTSLVMAGIFSMGIAFTAADVVAEAADSPECTSVVREAPVGGFFLDFSKEKAVPEGWMASDGWTNGNPFNSNWHKESVQFKKGTMQLSVTKETAKEGWAFDNKVPYTGGEFRSLVNNRFHYGLYEVCMKPAKHEGLMAGSFFTYTGPWDTPPTQWDEIDIEFIGDKSDKAQFNYYVDGVGGHEYMCDLGFDAAADFHVYAFRWEPLKITWYVDGKEVYHVEGNNLPVTPSMVMANIWAGQNVDEWLGHFDGEGMPLTASYKWMKFTPDYQLTHVNK